MSEIRLSVHRAARKFKGGIEALAVCMSSPERKVSPQILRNQLIGNERHRLALDDAEEIMDLCDSDELAQAAARQRGGVFIKLPETGEFDHEDLLAKFNELYQHLGVLSATFAKATQDGEVDKRERGDLQKAGQEIHATVEELLRLTFAVYCRD